MKTTKHLTGTRRSTVMEAGDKRRRDLNAVAAGQETVLRMLVAIKHFRHGDGYCSNCSLFFLLVLLLLLFFCFFFFVASVVEPFGSDCEEFEKGN